MIETEKKQPMKKACVFNGENLNSFSSETQNICNIKRDGKI
jgi:hypothetical protein